MSKSKRNCRQCNVIFYSTSPVGAQQFCSLKCVALFRVEKRGGHMFYNGKRGHQISWRTKTLGPISYNTSKYLYAQHYNIDYETVRYAKLHPTCGIANCIYPPHNEVMEKDIYFNHFKRRHTMTNTTLMDQLKDLISKEKGESSVWHDLDGSYTLNKDGTYLVYNQNTVRLLRYKYCDDVWTLADTETPNVRTISEVKLRDLNFKIVEVIPPFKDE